MKLFNWLRNQINDLSDWLHRQWVGLFVAVFIAAIISLVVQNPFQLNVPRYKVGDISRFDFKAPREIQVEDKEVMDRKRAIAEEKVLDVYDFDSRMEQQIAGQLKRAFKPLRKPKPPYKDADLDYFQSTLTIPISDEEWIVLKEYRFGRRIQLALQYLIQIPLSFWIVDNKLDLKEKEKITFRDIHTGDETEVSPETFKQKIQTLSEARSHLSKRQARSLNIWSKIKRKYRPPLESLAGKIIDINFVFNKIETQARKEETRSQVKSTFVEISKGEMIIREGDRVTREALLLLHGLRDLEKGRLRLKNFLGFAALLLFLVFVLHSTGSRNFNRFKMSKKDHMVIGGFFAVSVLFLAGTYQAVSILETETLPGTSLLLLLPIAFSGMTLRLFSSMEITTFFVLLLSMCMAWLWRDPFMGVLVLVSSLAGAGRMRHITQRIDIFKAGLIAGCVQAVLAILGQILGLLEGPGFEGVLINAGASIGFALASGLFSGAVVLSIQPLIEFLGYTTDLRLMELSNTNHPLLRELILKAPGTYFHSFTVSQLAEKAAEAIHANSLFARVASLYHDIGKTKKPEYFIENTRGENRHNKLVPSMSALIIANHVKEGIEIAHKQGLPQSIVDVIPQHHGTALISFFYDQAKKQSPDKSVDERDFRYAGPKPQTREAAIIMLADAVEATARVAEVKSQDDFSEIINNTINRFFLDGQLDECDLSLKDLTSIGSAFLQVLQGVYHQRIDYPHLKADGSKKHKAVVTKISRVKPASG